MNKKDLGEEADEVGLRRGRAPLVTSSDLIKFGIAALVNLGIVAFSYGILVQRVDNVEDSQRIFASRDITPGAERRISVLEAQVVQMRSDSVDWRRDFREQLDRIEAKVDAIQSGRTK